MERDGRHRILVALESLCQLRAFYAEHDPSKTAADVDAIHASYSAPELNAGLRAKYGAWPSLPRQALRDFYAAHDPDRTPDEVDEIYRTCLEDTIWFDNRGGYLGANARHGFYHPVLLQVADALRETFPQLFGPTDKLTQYWA